ncbi:MAG: phage terminase small subunit, partial [Sphingomonadales bacterium]
MASPARRHRERLLAATLAAGGSAAIAAPPPSDGPAATAYDQMLMQLAEDRRRLHDIQSIERKIALKAELIGSYDAWVDGALAEAEASGRAVQD